MRRFNYPIRLQYASILPAMKEVCQEGVAVLREDKLMYQSDEKAA